MDFTMNTDTVNGIIAEHEKVIQGHVSDSATNEKKALDSKLQTAYWNGRVSVLRELVNSVASQQKAAPIPAPAAEPVKAAPAAKPAAPSTNGTAPGPAVVK